MPQLNARQPVVTPDRTMTQPMREEMRDLRNAVPITGTGSPEGAVEGLVGQVYIDTSGSAGSILYIKRDSDISGDATQGWIAA